MSASKDLVKILKESDKKGTEPYDTEATVKRIDGSTAWVHIPGGVDETPVQLTIGSRVGDKVQVRVSGGRAWLVGNASAPPTDDSTAITINKQTNRYVKSVETKVDTVSKIAGDTDQYFWHTETGTDTGAHITEIPRERFLADPDNGGGNLLARSNGIAVRDGLTELATFGANGVTLGIDSLVEISPTGATPVTIQVSYEYPNTVDLSAGNPVQIDLSVIPFFALLSNGTRVAVQFASSGGANTPAFYKGTVSDGLIGSFYWLYDGASTFEIVPQTTLPAWASTKVICHSSYTTGGAYFALGKRSGDVGILSASFGEGLIASGNSQLVVGTYNEEDATKAVIVGNGTLNNEIESRSNALTVDWDGNVEMALDTTSASGTDHDLYAAITALGWESEVIV